MLLHSIGLLLISFFVSTFLLPAVRSFGINNKIIDTLNARKLKEIKLVRIGGISIFIGYLVSILVVCFLDKNIDLKFLTIILFGGFSYFLIGFFDDLKSTSPYLRLILQFLVAIFLWLNGIRIDQINLDFLGFGIFDLPLEISFLLTIVWISAVINSINWFDGLDGLAAGTTFLVSLFLLVISFSFQNNLIIYLLSSLTGSCLGFLRFNIYPAKILMGDCGSYFLGYNLAAFSLLAPTTDNQNTNLFLAILFLIIPLSDMVYVIFIRIKKGLSPYFPDMSHLHHRLMNLGLSHNNTVKIILSLLHLYSCVLLIVFFNIKYLIIISLTLFILIIYFLLKRINRYSSNITIK